MANTNELTITTPDGETLVVDASKFRAKPMNITRDLAAEYCYDEFLPEFGETLDDRDVIDSDVAIDAMLEKASEIRNKHVLAFLAKVSEQDALVAVANGEMFPPSLADDASDEDIQNARDEATKALPKKTERVRFERDLRRYQPARSRASKYSGQTRAMLKTRIAQLETHISELASAMADAGLDVPALPEFEPAPASDDASDTSDDASDDE